jgi:hypothetical protein
MRYLCSRFERGLLHLTVCPKRESIQYINRPSVLAMRVKFAQRMHELDRRSGKSRIGNLVGIFH